MRKRLLLIVTLATLVSSLVAGVGTPPAHAVTVFTRAINLPTGGQPTSAQGFISQCLLAGLTSPTCRKDPTARGQRCLYLTNPGLAQDGSAGKLGYVIPLSGDTFGNHNFSLVDPNNTRPGGLKFDFDVTFYQTLGSCAVVANVLTMGDGCDELVGQYPEPCEGAGPPVSARMLGDESGSIPFFGAGTTTYAIITMAFGGNANFTLTIQ